MFLSLRKQYRSAARTNAGLVSPPILGYSAMTLFNTPWDLIRHVAPNRPIACGRPHLVKKAADWFLSEFPGETLYAVKANPSKWVLETLYGAGLRHFDVASENEMTLVAELCPDATMSFMHPVKSRHAIRRAYFEFGVRTFSLDCEAEFDKIMDETENARDLTLIIRAAVSNQGAELPIDGKFGASPAQMITLLRRARPIVEELGLSFHPGSQCMDPYAWSVHCEQLSRVITDAGVDVDIIDVGGGFPVSYPGKEPPPMFRFASAIKRAFDRMPLPPHARLWCEPGRALVAEGSSVLTHVDLVRGNTLYINDGAFGTLYDAVHCKWTYPTRLIRQDGEPSSRLKAFRLFGPTCDSADMVPGPFFLPEDVREGDVIEIGMLGAYGVCMQTQFNGYGQAIEAFAADSPWASVFDNAAEPAKADWYANI